MLRTIIRAIDRSLIPAILFALIWWRINGVAWSLSNRLSPVFTPTVLRWENEIVRAAQKYELDPNMLATVVQVESCGDPAAVSPAGALSLAQVMPFHFQDGEDGMNPITNLDRGAAYLADRLEASGGEPEGAFAMYNGGPAAVNPVLRVSETQRYVVWSTGIYQDAASGAAYSPSLDRWLDAGGQALCDQAKQHPGPALFAQPLTSAAWVWPYRETPVITQDYHATEPGWAGYDVKLGCFTELVAPFPGTITYAGDDGLGNTMLTLTSRNGRVQMTILHLIIDREVGDNVRQGDVLGYESDIGNATGCHSHVIYKVDGQVVDFLNVQYR